MKNIKYYGLMCFFVIFSCIPFNISATEKFESVIEKARESVVLLSMNPNADPDTDPAQSALCSGVVVDNVGHVLTNFHCVHNNNYVRLFYYDLDDWQTYKVNVIGLDPLADLALLQVLDREGDPIPHLEFAKDADKIKSGMDVFALGHPMGMAWTVTKGIISSTERYARHPFIKALQTDAAINKGNSGGPLMNMKGEIIGINSLIVSRISESAGVGLAIRGDIVKKSFESMLMSGRVDRPAIGITIVALNRKQQRDKIVKQFSEFEPEFIPNTFGIMIRPSDDPLPLGLEDFDTIIAINNVFTNDSLSFTDEISKNNIGNTITLSIIRKKRFRKVDVPLKVFPVNVELLYPPQPKRPVFE